MILEILKRNKIVWNVRSKHQNTISDLVEQVSSNHGSGIIYCRRQETIQSIVRALEKNNISSVSDMTDSDKSTNSLEYFISGKSQILVTKTSEFLQKREDLNKANIEFTIHYELPYGFDIFCIESLPGDLGQPNKVSTLFFDYSEVRSVDSWADNKYRNNLSNKNQAFDQIKNLVGFVETTNCRHTFLCKKYGELNVPDCQDCDNCKAAHHVVDYTQDAVKLIYCVFLCKENFGIEHIAKVICGLEDEKITQRNHHFLPIYGKGNYRDATFWEILIQRLLMQDFLTLERGENYRILKMNPKSWRTLGKWEKVELIEEFFESSRKKGSITQKSKLSQEKSTVLQTLDLYSQGLSVEEIAQKQDLKVSTIYGHIYKLIEQGHNINTEQLVCLQKESDILATIQEHGDLSLKEYREILGDEYTFEELKIVQYKWKYQNSQNL